MSAYTPDDVLPAPQRRIRHITSLQVRNLTPFPARDALAQTLIQPGPNSSLLLQQPADDIELTLGSRRRRRVSAGSTSTVFNADADDEGGLSTTGTRRQKRASSSFQSIRSAVVTSGTSTIRQRARTGSKVSAVHAISASALVDSENTTSPGDWDGVPAGGQFVTHSQRALEKIVSSRLVESFVTLTQPPSPISSTSSSSLPSSPPVSPPMATVSAARKAKEVSVKRAISASAANHLRGTSTSSSTSTHSATSPLRSKRPQSVASPSPNSSSSHHRSGVSGRAGASSSKVSNFPSPPPTPPPLSPPSHSPSTSETRPSGSSSRKALNGHEGRPPSSVPTPFYISPPHLPSTNPRFSHLDPEREFAPWADLSGSHVMVTIWGGDYQSAPRNHKGDDGTKGKGKASAHLVASPSKPKDGTNWKILEEWVVDLDEMEPLSTDIASHHLPSNTLLLTVSSGETFRIPPVSTNLPSRAPSPLKPEYNSDGEVNETRRLRWEREESEARRRERETFEKSRRETRMKRSACWQDLVKLVNLQTCIIDTKESLEEIVRNCNLLLEGDGRNAALREISERDEWLRSLYSEREQLLRDSTRVKDSVEARRNALRLRRETLMTARAIHEQDLRDYSAQAQKVDSERQRHATLVTSLSPLRTTLIQTVSFIFPIEPLSAPDLLFTILGAPIPVPIAVSDPAPPPSSSSEPEVTEDNNATALGYIAQVIQLISAYLGKGLVYPVMCCGSRSVIKDPISAMMGPRTFPLYSKGVETYRFEYGVFLLNKDIEMLMMDRNLRAMDMRHTLPNVKNLLLTLTTGEDAEQTRRSGSLISVRIPSDLHSSTRTISPLALEGSQSEQGDGTHPKSARTITSRKSTPFLSPLAAILRARYPSSVGRPTVRVVDETPEPAVEDSSSIAANPDTRHDIDDTVPPNGEESKATLKAIRSSAKAHDNSLEKLAKGDEPPTPPSPLTSAT